MADPFVPARDYCEHAASLREMAALDENLKTQKGLFAVAEQYGALCKKLLTLARNSKLHQLSLVKIIHCHDAVVAWRYWATDAIVRAHMDSWRVVRAGNSQFAIGPHR
jgi:hypothetical protein